MFSVEHKKGELNSKNIFMEEKNDKNCLAHFFQLKTFN